MKQWLLSAGWLWLALVGPTQLGAVRAADAPADPDASEAIEFRRVFAPADRFEDWPLGGEAYLPIESSEFDRLVQAANQGDAGTPGVDGVQLASAEYRASLLGDNVLTGEAVLDITGQPASQILLPLEPLGLAISKATWQGDSPRAAALGRSANGRVGVLVDRPGRLKLVWSLRGRRGPQGELAFSFELPRSATNHLRLDLPDDLSVDVDAGLLEPEAATAATKSWTIDLGGSHRCVVRVAKAGAVDRQPPALLRQSVSYEFSPRGVEVTAQLHLDVRGEPLRQLSVQLDPRLRLVAARVADREVPWTIGNDKTGVTRVVLDLPEPVAGTGRTIRLLALATLDERIGCRLPQVLVEGVAWLEGKLTLVVPKPLVLDRVDPDGCTQLNAAPLAAPLSGESLEFQCFRPSANIEVVLTQPAEQFHVDTGSIVELGGTDIACRAIAEFSLRQDEQFRILADLGPDWSIDSVEALEPSDPAVINDWYLDSIGGAGKRLDIRLKHSVSARQSLRMLITGHHPGAPASGLKLGELEMLPFAQANLGKHWMAIRAGDAQELRIRGGDDLARIDPNQLTPAELRLFPKSEIPSGLVFAVDAAARQQTIATVPRKPTYGGEINVDVVADGKTLTETYTLRCSSPSARVERVTLLCSQARREPPRFSLAGVSGGQITSRRLTEEDPTPPGLSKDGEAWELTLRLPRNGTFEIRAVRSFPFSDLVPLSLAALADAATQRGTLTIRALGETGIGIENHGLRLIPPELTEPEYYPTTRGCYRYEPLRDVSSTVISVRPTASPSGESGAWVWQSELESRYALRDSTAHLARWNVQTRGRSRLKFTLPAGATLRGVVVDGAPLAEALVSGLGSSFSVSLPPGKQFATVSLSYLGEGRLPRLAGGLTAAWPEVDVPVLSRQWKIWLPPGYEMTGAGGTSESPSSGSLAWSQRLFGPLGRPAWQTMFHPLRLADWSALWLAREEAGALDVRRFSQALGDTVAAHRDDSEPLTWGRLSELLSGSAALSGMDVLVDSDSLKQIGLGPESLVPSRGKAAGIELADAIFDQAEMLLRYNDQVLVLSAAASGELDDSRADRAGPATWLGPGPLADEITRSLRGGSSQRFVSLAIWARQRAALAAPWLRTASDDAGKWATHGWSVHVIPMGSEVDQAVAIVRPATMQSCAWAVFLLVFATGIWWKPAKWIWLAAAVPGFAAIALITSATYAPLSAAAFLAAVGALAWSAIDRRHPLPIRDRSRSTSSRSLVAPVLLLMSFGLALGAAVQTWAEEPAGIANENVARPDAGTSATTSPLVTDAKETAASGGKSAAAPPIKAPADRARRIPRVFIPVDAQRRPQGSKIYLPRDLFRRLSERAAKASRQPGDWLMTRANYQVLLSRENAQQTVAVADCKAVFDLEVFHSGDEVSVPVGAGGVTLVPGSAKLDGQPVNVERSPSGDRLSWVVDQAGSVRLEVSLAPEIRSDGTTARFDIPTAALPVSTLTVSSVGEPVPFEIPEARGAIVSSSASVQAELGASDQLTVTWPEERRGTAAPAKVEVDELLWVNLQAGLPLIDARFKCRSAEGPVRHLRILADRRLQLLPSDGRSSVIKAIHATPQDPVVLDLDLAPVENGADHEVVVDLTFLVTETSGVGNFRLPRLEVAGAAGAKRLLAVTLDPALHYDEQLGDDVKAQTAADFLMAWGPASQEPQLVYAIPRGIAAWLLTTRQPEPRNVVEQAVICSFGQDTADVHCSATVTTPAGHNFQLRLIGPVGLDVQNVSLIEDEVQRVARWATDNAGGITVFLTGAVSGRQQFSLDGRLRTPIVGEVALSSFQWPGAELKENRIDIFRQATTLIQMRETAGVSSVEVAAEDRVKPEWGRLVASYLLDDPQAQLKVQLEENKPETHGQQVLIVDRDHDDWKATIDLELQVQEGLIDVLRFDVPPQWAEPYQFDPAGQVKSDILHIPSENRRQLIVRPLAPISGDYALRITGRLVPSLGDRLGVADVTPQGLGPIQRYVVLPRQLGVEQVVWETPGLARVQLPRELRKRLALRSGMQTFQVAERFQASLKGIEHAEGKPHVRLVDVHYVWEPDGNCYGVCAFDLTAANDESAVIDLPPTISLVSLTVADLPAAVTSAGAHSWRFALGPPQLPQRIEVTFQGTVALGAGSSGPLRFEAPRLQGLEVDETLWSVYGPSGSGPGQPVDAPAAAATHLELARLEATKVVLGQAAHVASEQIREEMVRWQALWKERLRAARARVQNLRLTSHQAGDRSDLETWTREEAEIASHLESGTISPATASSPALEPLELLTAQAADSHSLVCGQFAGSAPALAVRYSQAPRGDFAWRLVVSLLLIGLAGVLVWRPPFQRSIRISPARLVALLGAGWWLWLSPSVVGFAILIATLMLGLAARMKSASAEGLRTLPTG